MKILFFLAALANVVLFMWEFRQGAFERDAKTAQQPLRERVLLVSELKHERMECRPLLVAGSQSSDWEPAQDAPNPTIST